MPIAATLFDLDGTLVDSNDFHIRAWHQAFDEAGFQIALDAIRGQIGKGADNLVPTLLPDLTRDQVKALAEAEGTIFERFLEQIRPFPHAHDLLARVHAAGAKVVLASSASGEQLDHYIDLIGVRGLIHDATSNDDVERSKPDPDIFAAALRQAGVPPEQAIAIGDTRWDVLAAARCGVRTIGVLSGGIAESELREAGAIAIYADVAALLDDFEASPLAR
ncbi:HAD family hydrolase [Sphingomonas gei]|uniref:HAD family hydrolase n=1 Tax=Sphingomonas gei TaxID=1395960 RepID=A0A4S1XIS2_9SPHN|nr:HAD family hydrolase [Sphingomonas gei]TGX55640.1 HAD family hydrolase [Sphingomonas gei]